MRQHLSTIALVISVVTAGLSALAMRDHVRLVEIVGLFASGIGTGASIVAGVIQQRARRASRDTA
jgi:hypothetical protein